MEARSGRAAEQFHPGVATAARTCTSPPAPWPWPPTCANIRQVPLTCYLDAFSGISGDMLVGALADAGADRDAIPTPSPRLRAVPRFPSRSQAARYRRHQVPRAVQEAHVHRHLSHIVKMIEKPILRARPAECHRRLPASRRGRSAGHQVPIEKVHFHEVGAADSIADIVGACLAFDLLDVGTIVCSPLNVGSGTVKTEHGLLPVPARLRRCCWSMRPSMRAARRWS